jgi:two-component system, OmpR family, phosphate regulon sensor histidine kinase PhoR
VGVAIKFRTPAGWLDGSAWVFVLLALLTLVPAACVLWFMNDALTRESDASRQRVLEAYRGQLRLVRARLDPLWRAHAASLDAAGDPEQQFQQLTVTHAADGVVLLDRDGGVTFPDRDAGHSRQGREIERRLSALEAFNPKPGQEDIDAMAARLNDYTTHLPAPERLRLMDRLRALAPNVSLPTQAAMHLSLEMLDAERPAPVPEVIRQTAVPDIFALTSVDSRVIAFYRTGRLEAMMHDFLHQITSAGIVFIAFPPDESADAEAIAAGPWLPGWQLSFVVLNAPDAPGPDRRGSLYLSVGLAGLVVMMLIGVAAGQTLRRHLRVARLKTDLVAAASHELRTPLASMRVLVDGLLADTHVDAAKTREYLEMMAVENARLSRLIENFLTFSRLDRGRYPFAIVPAEPSAIVTSAVEAVRDRLPATSTLEVDVEPTLPLVMVDAEAVGTALVNLLDNALKYTPDLKKIIVRACRDGDGFVQFVVSDNGIGIPVREQRRIFRRFYRVDQRLARETGGVGLGLSIVELIARGHGGTVTVRSEPGEGSTFTMRVPRAAGEASA